MVTMQDALALAGRAAFGGHPTLAGAARRFLKDAGQECPPETTPSPFPVLLKDCSGEGGMTGLLVVSIAEDGVQIALPNGCVVSVTLANNVLRLDVWNDPEGDPVIETVLPVDPNIPGPG